MSKIGNHNKCVCGVGWVGGRGGGGGDINWGIEVVLGGICDYLIRCVKTINPIFGKELRGFRLNAPKDACIFSVNIMFCCC